MSQLSKKIMTGRKECLTYIGHVVDAVTGPLAPDDPHGEAGDAEEDGDGHTEPNEKTEVGDDDTDTVSREVRSLA